MFKQKKPKTKNKVTTFQFQRTTSNGSGKTARAAQARIRNVYGVGYSGTAYDVEKTAHKQKTYGEALKRQESNVAALEAKLKTGGIAQRKSGIFTGRFTFGQKGRDIRAQAQKNRTVKADLAKATKALTIIQQKSRSYNAQAAKRIEQIMSRKGSLGADTTSNVGKQLLALKEKSNAAKTLAAQTPGASTAGTAMDLSKALDLLKKANESKRVAFISPLQQSFNSARTKKAGLDIAVINAEKAYLVAKTNKKQNPEAFKTAKQTLTDAIKATQTNEYKQNAKFIQTQGEALLKTQKINFIKFNNLYSVSRGTAQGNVVKQRAKSNTFYSNTQKNLKQAKYGNIEKLRPYTGEIAQTSLIKNIQEAAVINQKMKNDPNYKPTKADFELIKRATKSKAILGILQSQNLLPTMKNPDGTIVDTPHTKYVKSILGTQNKLTLQGFNSSTSSVGANGLKPVKAGVTPSMNSVKQPVIPKILTENEKIIAEQAQKDYDTEVKRRDELQKELDKLKQKQTEDDPIIRNIIRPQIDSLNAQLKTIDADIKSHMWGTSLNETKPEVIKLRALEAAVKSDLEKAKTKEVEYGTLDKTIYTKYNEISSLPPLLSPEQAEIKKRADAEIQTNYSQTKINALTESTEIIAYRNKLLTALPDKTESVKNLVELEKSYAANIKKVNEITNKINTLDPITQAENIKNLQSELTYLKASGDDIKNKQSIATITIDRFNKVNERLAMIDKKIAGIPEIADIIKTQEAEAKAEALFKSTPAEVEKRRAFYESRAKQREIAAAEKQKIADAEKAAKAQQEALKDQQMRTTMQSKIDENQVKFDQFKSTFDTKTAEADIATKKTQIEEFEKQKTVLKTELSQITNVTKTAEIQAIQAKLLILENNINPLKSGISSNENKLATYKTLETNLLDSKYQLNILTKRSTPELEAFDVSKKQQLDGNINLIKSQIENLSLDELKTKVNALEPETKTLEADLKTKLRENLNLFIQRDNTIFYIKDLTEWFEKPYKVLSHPSDDAYRGWEDTKNRYFPNVVFPSNVTTNEQKNAYLKELVKPKIQELADEKISQDAAIIKKETDMLASTYKLDALKTIKTRINELEQQAKTQTQAQTPTIAGQVEPAQIYNKKSGKIVKSII